MEKFIQENGLYAGLEPSGDPPSALPEKTPPVTVSISIIEYSQFVLNEIFQDIFGRREKMSELTQAALDGDTSSELNWQPADTQERTHAQNVRDKKMMEIKNIVPLTLVTVLKYFRKFFNR